MTKRRGKAPPGLRRAREAEREDWKARHRPQEERGRITEGQRKHLDGQGPLGGHDDLNRSRKAGALRTREAARLDFGPRPGPFVCGLCEGTRYQEMEAVPPPPARQYTIRICVACSPPAGANRLRMEIMDSSEGGGQV